MFKFAGEWEDINFYRVCGGIAWPGERPGFIVILGEELERARHAERTYCHYVLAAVEESNLQRFFDKCAMLTVDFKVQQFFGKPLNEKISCLCDYNKQGRKLGRPRIKFWNALRPGEDLIERHINKILEKTRPGNQTLYIGNSILQGHLETITDANVGTATEEEFPAAAALGYPLLEMATFSARYDEGDNDKGPDRRTACRSTGY